MASSSGWFEESEVLWPGQRLSLKVKECLYDERSKFQHIQVFESETYGRVLVLDGAIQVTQRDEFAYQEMIVHLPMLAHRCPKRVLVIGGGDGGVLREVCKHRCVEHVTMCEIDKQVVDVSVEYLPFMSAGAFKDSRVQLVFDDAAEHVKTCGAAYDVIIVDSSDPVGPAVTLFEESFHRALYSALAPSGIVCSQGECIWLHLELIERTMDIYRHVFTTPGAVQYAFATIPTYPSGQIGFIMCRRDNDDDSDDDSKAMNAPCRPVDEQLLKTLRYYDTDVHSAAFVLPRFAKHLSAAQT
jgi:spermidine synthase